MRVGRAVAFDLDCTLIDFVRFKRVASEEAARAMVDAGLDLPWEEAMRKVEAAYYAHGIDGDEAFARFLEAETGEAPPALLAAGIQAYLRAKQGLLQPYPRTIPTLIQLIKRGYALGIVTDAPRGKALQRLHATGLFHFFDAVVTADDTLDGKASALPFQLLARRLGLRVEELAMVGDHPERDIAPARKLGMFTVFAKYGADTRPHGPRDTAEADAVIERVEELLQVFQKRR